jgi:hypothetical protein
VGSLAWRLRALLLLAAGSFAVHELRYLLAYHHRSERELALQGHAYLGVLAPVLGVLLVAALLRFAWRLLVGARGSTGAVAVPAFPRLWPAASACLAATYCVQEWLEGELYSGHPAGISGVFGHGGWTALLLALAVGAALALALRGAATAATRGGPGGRWLAPAPSTLFAVESPSPPLRRLPPLACSLAARGPPPASA